MRLLCFQKIGFTKTYYYILRTLFDNAHILKINAQATKETYRKICSVTLDICRNWQKKE